MTNAGRVILDAIFSAMCGNTTTYKVVAMDVFSNNQRVILHKGTEEDCKNIVLSLRKSIRYSEAYHTEIL
jgi:hypothetical protein